VQHGDREKSSITGHGRDWPVLVQFGCDILGSEFPMCPVSIQERIPFEPEISVPKRVGVSLDNEVFWATLWKSACRLKTLLYLTRGRRRRTDAQQVSRSEHCHFWKRKARFGTKLLLKPDTLPKYKWAEDW